MIPDALRLARLQGATVHVLGVSPPPALYGDTAAAAIAAEQADVNYLEKVCDRFASEGVMATAAVREGPPGWEISKFAEEIRGGLVCLVTHGRTGVARALVGSVTEDVLRTAPCPVFVRRTVSAPAAARATA